MRSNQGGKRVLKKNAPLLILIGLVVLLTGYLGFTAFDQEKNTQPPQQAQGSSGGGTLVTPNMGAGQKPPEEKKEKTKSKIPDTDPEQGEIFVEGQVIAVDVEKRILTIDQHMDDNSVTITPNVAISNDAIIQNNEADVSLAEIKVNDVVGMILTKEKKARAVLVNF